MSESAHEPVERRGVRLGCSGEFLGTFGSSRQVIRQAQFGRDINNARDPVGRDARLHPASPTREGTRGGEGEREAPDCRRAVPEGEVVAEGFLSEFDVHGVLLEIQHNFLAFQP